MKKLKNRRAQEEMVGFGMIVVIVAIIGLIFLWFFLTKPHPKNLDDYEVKSFVNSLMQYTSDCKEPGKDFIRMNELLYWCADSSARTQCYGGLDACELLNNTLNGITKESWSVGPDLPFRGYELNVLVLDGNEEVISQLYSKSEGNLSGDLRGAKEIYFKGSNWYEVIFNVYY